jgi:hypothetical protein
MFITDGFERVMKQITENNERLKNPNDPHPVAQFIAILDFQGFPYSQFLNFRGEKINYTEMPFACPNHPVTYQFLTLCEIEFSKRYKISCIWVPCTKPTIQRY